MISRRRLWLGGIAATVLGVVAASTSWAHKTNLSTSRISVVGEALDYRLTVSAHDMAIALGIETDLVTPVPRAEFESREGLLIQYLQSRLKVFSGAEECPQDLPEVDYSTLPTDLHLRIGFLCDGPIKEFRLVYLVFFDIDAQHRAIGTIDYGSGPEEFLIETSDRELEFGVREPAPPRPWIARGGRILVLGVEHILAGIDHILFLVALLLVSTRPLALVKVVTAFTLAHSVTLGLAWYGVLALPSKLVESGIALSIAYVAAENLTGRRLTKRWMVAFGFGLVHGLGFYQVLSRLDLRGSGAATALLAFNLGVEVGQLAIVAVAYPLLALSFRWVWYDRVMRAASTAILAMAGFWFIQRAFIF